MASSTKGPGHSPQAIHTTPRTAVYLINFILFTQVQIIVAFELRPVNTIAEVGSEVRLRCRLSGNTSLEWYHYGLLSTSDIKEFGDIFKQEKTVFPATTATIHPDIDVYYEGDTSVLRITSVQGDNAGLYGCRDVSTQELTKFALADIVVIGAGLNCSVTVSILQDTVFVAGDNVTVSCQIEYDGNLPPSLKWSNDNMFDSGRHLESYIIASSALDGQSLKCNVTFPAQTQPTSEVNQATQYYVVDRSELQLLPLTYWKSNKLDVLYPPERFELTPMEEEYSEGEKISCTAAAKPEAIFSWFTNDTDILLVNGTEFEVPQHEDNNTNIYLVKCVASNIMREKTVSSSISLRIQVKEPPLLEGWAIGVIAAAGVALIAAVVIVVYILAVRSTGPVTCQCCD